MDISYPSVNVSIAISSKNMFIKNRYTKLIKNLTCTYTLNKIFYIFAYNIDYNTPYIKAFFVPVNGEY